MRGGWVYIVTNRPNGTLYTGVTSNIARRAYEHRQGLIKGFSNRGKFPGGRGESSVGKYDSSWGCPLIWVIRLSA